jgi:hypothetical protein
MQHLLRHQATLDAIKSGKRPAWNLDEFLQRRAKYLLY